MSQSLVKLASFEKVVSMYHSEVFRNMVIDLVGANYTGSLDLAMGESSR